MDGEDGEKYVTSANIRKTFGVSLTTLRNWADTGRVRVVRIGKGGKRLYHCADITKEFAGYRPRTEQGKEAAAAPVKKAKVCYARVSSAKQRDDLTRQVEALRREFPEHEIVTDVASGINWKRPGFLSILDRAMSGAISEVVVAHRDRLCRLAFELIEHILKRSSCRLVVLHKGDEGDAEDTGELRDDLLAIVTVFVASNNGRRAAANRRANKERAAREAAEAAAARADADSSGEESSDDSGSNSSAGGSECGPGDEVQKAADISDD